MPTVRPRTTIYLWEFLLQLLDGETFCEAISWVNRERGEFVLKDQSEIAKLWGRVKGRPRMDKIKLGRAMRYYYKKKLLAKVPRRKAVYRFTKFDHMQEKQAEIIRHEDFPEIDFSDSAIAHHVNDENSKGDASRSAEVDEDEDNTPLERLLAERNQQMLYNVEKCQRLVPVEDSLGSLENISDSGCSFYDYGNNATDLRRQNDDYYVPCSDMNSVPSCERQNVPSCPKGGSFEPVNYNVLHQCCYPTVDNNGNYPQWNVETGGHLASLLMNSILMSDQQISEDSANLRQSYNTIPVSCTSASSNLTPEAVVSPTLSHMKSEHFEDNITAAVQFPTDIDTESAWGTVKEFERLLMINRSF